MKSEANSLQLGAPSRAPPKAGSICLLMGQTGTSHPCMHPWAAIKGCLPRESLENATQNMWAAVNGLCLEPSGKPHKHAHSLVQTCPAGRQLRPVAVWNGSSKFGQPNCMMPILGNTNPPCFASLTQGNGFLGLSWKLLDMMQKGSLKSHSKPIYAFN